MKRERKWVIYALGAMGLCVLLGAVLVVVGLIAGRAGQTPPQVTITGTFPEDSAVARQPVVVFGEASDSSGVAFVEMWINGQKVGAQNNPDPKADATFGATHSWIPNGAGDFLVTFKAADVEGFIGESDPVLIAVRDRIYEPDPDAVGKYVAVQGDTWESIAEELGLTPARLHELNPGVGDLTPGTSLDVPLRPEGDDPSQPGTASGGASGGATPASDSGGPPRVDPAEAPPAPAPATPAEVQDAPTPLFPWLGPLGNFRQFACLINPSGCAPSVEAEPPTPAPGPVTAELGTCSVRVTWVDNSENELGFRLSRISRAGDSGGDVVALFDGQPGAGTTLEYVDQDPPGGSFLYYVEAYNAGGGTMSAPSVQIDDAWCASVVSAMRAVVVEGLGLTVGEGYDRLYCYVSLTDSPFERVPAGTDEFITLAEGEWNIAEHFGGENKRAVMVAEDGPLNLVVECLGWQGADLINLGRFARSHPPSDWDGRTLQATSDSGGFTAAYRINGSDEEIHTALFPLIDPTLAPPYNVRETDRWSDCSMATGTLMCTTVRGPGIAWDYVPSPTVPPGVLPRFKVYIDFDTADPTVLTTTDPDVRDARQLRRRCDSVVYYSVSAIVGWDAATGTEIETPRSGRLRLAPTCAILEITLEELIIDEVHDNEFCLPVSPDCQDWHPVAETYEAYGWFRFGNENPILWMHHCEHSFGSGCLSDGYVEIVTPGTLTTLSYVDSGQGLQAGNTTWRIPLHEGEVLWFEFQLWDHDPADDDDLWCGYPTTYQVQLLGDRDVEDWRLLDRVISTRDEYFTSDFDCEIRFRVRGLPPGA